MGNVRELPLSLSGSSPGSNSHVTVEIPADTTLSSISGRSPGSHAPASCPTGRNLGERAEGRKGIHVPFAAISALLQAKLGCRLVRAGFVNNDENRAAPGPQFHQRFFVFDLGAGRDGFLSGNLQPQRISIDIAPAEAGRAATESRATSVITAPLIRLRIFNWRRVSALRSSTGDAVQRAFIVAARARLVSVRYFWSPVVHRRGYQSLFLPLRKTSRLSWLPRGQHADLQLEIVASVTGRSLRAHTTSPPCTPA